MGTFDFIKDIGKKLTGREEPKATAAPTAPAAPAKPAMSAADLQQMKDRARSTALIQEIARLRLGIEGLSVKVAGSVATIHGTAPDQATKEKVVLAVGNTVGIARVDDQMEVSTAEPEAQFYTVVSGDSLSKIAKKFYGDAMKYPVIFEANKPMLADPDKIYPGQVLRIPALD